MLESYKNISIFKIPDHINPYYMQRLLILFSLSIFLIACSSSDDGNTTETDDNIENPTDDDVATNDDDGGDEMEVYFPPITGTVWETTSLSSLDWDEDAFTDLNLFLEDSETEAFIILHNGRIVVEEYYQGTDATTIHRWNSAAKTIIATSIGLAQEDGFLNIDDATQDYLGENWTAMTPEQEAEITIRNQLTMTSGSDYTLSNNTNCTDPECITFLSTPGDEWYYNNGLYTLLQDVVTAATGEDFDDYFDRKIQSEIGMSGTWLSFGFLNLYRSTARDMARFGLLNLNEGDWDGTQLVPPSYFTEMTTTSQDLNNAYGYLWWLNGKDDYKLPSTTATFSGSLIPTAPDDLFAGLGAGDQKMYIVPSENLVVIRMGNSPDPSILGPSSYDSELWERIMEVIN